MGSLILAEVSTGTVVLMMLVAAIVGAAAAFGYHRFVAQRDRANAQGDADRIVADAKQKAREATRAAEVETKASFLTRQEEFDSKTAKVRNELRDAEKRTDKREDVLERKLDMLGTKEKNVEVAETRLREQRAKTEEKADEIDDLLRQQRNELLKATKLSLDDAKKQLFRNLSDELEHECAEMIDKRVAAAEDEAEERSRKIVIAAIERYAAAQTTETTVTAVEIPNDEMKGRVIGREGRNIRAFEKATGVDVVVDDTPGIIVVTGFDPVRREVARQAMSKLIQDGRIHPTRIEEVVEEVRDRMEKHIVDLGKKGAMEANVTGLNRKLTDLLGRLSFRTSYGQNVLRHSIEVAYLCQVMADELGLNGTLARRCGLLHDIGKAVDHEIEGGHPAIGAEICRKFNEPPEVLNAVAGHHGDVPATSPYTPLVTAADAISASRPGSRRESLERYIKRLTQLEDIAKRRDGVTQAYAIQAGREIRVIVDAEKVDDASAMKIARDIAKQIEQDMTYPGEVKVTLLREVRAIEYAR